MKSMIRLSILVAVIVLVIRVGMASSAFGTTTSPDDPLVHLRPGHPRLLMTDEELTAALAATKTDPLRAELNRHIIVTAEFILTAPPIRQPDQDLNQEQDRYAVYDILTEAMAYRITGDERFLSRAKKDLLTVSSFSDWNPKHFLSVGEMSFAVAIGYDWLYPNLNSAERAAIKRALVDKSLLLSQAIYADPVNGRTPWSTKTTGNQNNVINSGLLSAALALADEEPAMARTTIAGVCKSLPNGMAEYAPDGGYSEGPGYWTYATTYSAIAIAEMEGALGTDCGLSASSGFSRTIDYYEAVEGPFGPVFNYSDATDDLQISPARAWLAMRFHAPFALQHARSLLADYLEHNSVVPFDRGIQGTVVNRFFALHAIWFPPVLPGPFANPSLDAHLSGVADIATFRSAWNDPNAIFVGVKAGDNDDHHKHLDLGSFVMDADGQRWAMDLGPDSEGGSYELPNYFDVKGGRWVYFRTNNHGHNTVTPGDGLQSWQVVAPITKYASMPERSFAVVDLTPVYPNAAAGLQRGITLLDRARVLVQDEYQPTQSNLPLHWAMVTKAKINLAADGHSATLTSGGRTLRVDLLEPASAKLTIGSTRPPMPVENQNDGTSMLKVDVSSGADERVVRLALLLTPVGDKWPRLNPPVLKPLAEW